jgi:hypothetical protein
LTACGSSQRSSSSDAFDQNLKKWNEAGIRNYDYTASLITTGPRGFAFPVVISVCDGNYAAIRAVDKDNVAGMDGYVQFNTVDKMFDLVRTHARDKYPPEVTYNAQYGYPEKVWFHDIRLPVDAARSYEISKLVVVDASATKSQPTSMDSTVLAPLKRFAESYEPKSGREVIPSPPVLDPKLSELIANASKTESRAHEPYVLLIFLKLSRFNIEHFKQSYELGRENPLTKEFYRIIGETNYEKAELMPSYLSDNYVEKHPELLEYAPIKAEMQRIEKAGEKIKPEALKN